MDGDYQIMKALHQFSEGTRTASVYLLQGKDKFLVLYYDSQDDYNDAGYFDFEVKAEEAAEDWVMRA
jgi:hypothetical protein